jgi:hypothetical protein
MPRIRGKGDKLNGSMKYMHMREIGSKAICGRTGVHTTLKHYKVTCQFCKDIMEKAHGKPLHR